MPAILDRNVVLEMRNIVKQFPKVLANNNINIKLYEGEILSLLGENGAGKSTLMNVLYGLYKPTSGDIFLNGEKVSFSSPKDAILRGLGMVHQHFMLVETLSVTENIILGSEPGKAGVIDYKTAREEVKNLSEKYGLNVDPDALVESMPVGLQQRVEILKALYRKANVLILDEPTAVLTPQEVDELFEVIKTLVATGVSVIIITHKLEEVKEISDRSYILRRGEISGECNTADVSKEELANLMVGRDVVLTVQKETKASTVEPVLKIRGLNVKNDKGIVAVSNLNLDIRPGEIVGVAGVDGNGQTELAEAVRSLRDVESGTILFKEEDITSLKTKELIDRKMAYVPADRHRFGLVLPMTVAENTVLGYHDREPAVKSKNSLIMNLGEIAADAEALVEQYDIRTPGVQVPAGTLSGGNQQKVILAREFSREPEFLLVTQPTRGLDVGAIEYIHSQILAMRDKGVAILLISLELEEIFSLSDRIEVMFEGRLVKEFSPEETDEKEVGLYMTGGNTDAE
ncbi:MAG: ABC transporter ATP-binding protein [Spirochaetales bacterium]|uniref:ABC transporter ATP-binding protein n=1 Tax=Candidatus Thalassospirochaeta sargassi TaxID=3119039 RepID=A0AAJ1MNH6_9SPIO|nr:ABC transporter ATP-binding protein [Spirochaetales bacterium]